MAEPAAFLIESSSATAASRSARSCATRSTARLIRSSRLASASSSARGAGAASILRCLWFSLERGLGLGYQGAEGRRIVQGHFRQRLAIQLNPGLLQTAHEAAVRDFGSPAGRANAHDPQGAEITLLQAPPFVAVAERFLDRFLRGAIKLALG